MVEGDSLTCPLCGGNNFVDVVVSASWYCSARYDGGAGSAPVVTSAPGVTDIQVYSNACGTCGFVIHRVDTDQLKSAVEAKASAEAYEAKEAAETRAEKKAEKEAKEKRKAEKKEKKIAALKKKLDKLEND